MDRVNKWRKAHGYYKVKRYLKVIEDQKTRGYPAPHLWFPSLKYLAPIKVLQKLWPWGNLDLTPTWSGRPAEYIQKYISKMEGRDSMMSFMWFYHLRLYSTSRDFEYQTELKNTSGWVFFGSAKFLRAKEMLDQLIKEGYSSSNLTIFYPRGG
jgi:hypothetical protein